MTMVRCNYVSHDFTDNCIHVFSVRKRMGADPSEDECIVIEKKAYWDKFTRKFRFSAPSFVAGSMTFGEAEEAAKYQHKTLLGRSGFKDVHDPTYGGNFDMKTYDSDLEPAFEDTVIAQVQDEPELMEVRCLNNVAVEHRFTKGATYLAIVPGTPGAPTLEWGINVYDKYGVLKEDLARNFEVLTQLFKVVKP